MLTGHLPFERNSPIEVLRAHLSERPKPPSAYRAEVPAALAAMTQGERATRHRTLAILLATDIDNRERETLNREVVAAIAEHAIAGNCADLAVPFALEAGRRALAVFALVDAKRLLEAGLACIVADSDDRATRLAYVRALGEVERQTGRGAQAVAYLTEAVAIAEEIGEMAGFGRLLTNLAKAHQIDDQYDAALAILERATAACLAEKDEAGAARALITSGRIHFFQGQADAARTAAFKGLKCALEGGEHGITGLAYAFLGYLTVTTDPGHLSDGVGYLHQAVFLLESVGDRVRLNDAQDLLGNAETMLGEFQRAREAFEVCARICREYGLREGESIALVNLAIAAIEQGDVTTAQADAERSQALAEAVGSKMALGMALVLQGVATAFSGQPHLAETLACDARQLAREIKNHYLEAAILPRQMEVFIELGHFDEALAAAAEWEALVTATGQTEPEGWLAGWKGLALTQVGRLAGC